FYANKIVQQNLRRHLRHPYKKGKSTHPSLIICPVAHKILGYTSSLYCSCTQKYQYRSFHLRILSVVPSQLLSHSFDPLTTVLVAVGVLHFLFPFSLLIHFLFHCIPHSKIGRSHQ